MKKWLVAGCILALWPLAQSLPIPSDDWTASEKREAARLDGLVFESETPSAWDLFYDEPSNLQFQYPVLLGQPHTFDITDTINKVDHGIQMGFMGRLVITIGMYEPLKSEAHLSLDQFLDSLYQGIKTERIPTEVAGEKAVEIHFTYPSIAHPDQAWFMHDGRLYSVTAPQWLHSRVVTKMVSTLRFGATDAEKALSKTAQHSLPNACGGWFNSSPEERKKIRENCLAACKTDPSPGCVQYMADDQKTTAAQDRIFAACTSDIATNCQASQPLGAPYDCLWIHQVDLSSACAEALNDSLRLRYKIPPADNYRAFKLLFRPISRRTLRMSWDTHIADEPLIPQALLNVLSDHYPYDFVHTREEWTFHAIGQFPWTDHLTAYLVRVPQHGQSYGGPAIALYLMDKDTGAPTFFRGPYGIVWESLALALKPDTGSLRHSLSATIDRKSSEPSVTTHLQITCDSPNPYAGCGTDEWKTRVWKGQGFKEVDR